MGLNKKNESIHIDFLGIGVQKAGTSWLFKQLSQIPQFDLLPEKEIHYFDRNRSYSSPNTLSETYFIKRIFNFNHIKSALKDLFFSIMSFDLKKTKFYLKWHFSNYNDNWYLSLFKNLNGFKGEITPSYSILKEEDIRKIYRLTPKAKLILMLRNPIERAWSAYRYQTRLIKDFSINNISYNEIIEFMEGDNQSLRSDYINTISNFSKVFPKEQILICFYDAIIDNPEMLLDTTIKFICGDIPISIRHLELRSVYNKSRKIDIPQKVKKFLKDKYYSQIRQLAEMYGGYFNKWYEDTYGEVSSNNNKRILPTMHV